MADDNECKFILYAFVIKLHMKMNLSKFVQKVTFSLSYVRRENHFFNGWRK